MPFNRYLEDSVEISLLLVDEPLLVITPILFRLRYIEFINISVCVFNFM